MNERGVSRIRRENEWKRIEQEIQREIATGILHPHDRLRSEGVLARQYKVGLYAVRQALKNLKKRGLLYSKPRSGMYVAEGGPTMLAVASEAEEGLHAFEIIHGSTCRLRFIVTNWASRNKAMWERICRDVSAIHPALSVEPVFPRSARDFDVEFSRSDLAIMGVTDGRLQSGVPQVALLDQAEMESFPIADRYIAATGNGEGKFFGVPFSTTFLVGVINDRLLSLTAQRMLQGARSWSEVLEMLRGASVECPQAAYLNFHPVYTLNFLQHLTHVGGAIVNPATAAIRLQEPAFHDALAELDALREKVFQRQGDATLDVDNCMTCLEWTYMFQRNPAFRNLKPWLFPLGRQGNYMEGLNICVISQVTPYPAECHKVLHYLLSDPVQREIEHVSGEHPVSRNISNPFGGYDERWRRVLSEMSERSQVFHTIVPGFIDFIQTIFSPAMAQFYTGQSTVSETIGKIVDKGGLFFARRTLQGPQA